MNLLVTGFTSEIASEVINQFKSTRPDIKIITVGRDPSSDFICDFSNYSSVIEFVKHTLPELDLSYIFLNHGILYGEKALNLSEEQLRKYMMVNCYSYIAILEAVSNHENLNTVIMSSISGKEGSYDPIYAATKAGVDSFRYKSRNNLPSSSRLNFISPGIISDAKMTTIREDIANLATLKEKTPTKNFTTSREVASMIVYLLNTPGNINFQDIAINGGMSFNK